MTDPAEQDPLVLLQRQLLATAQTAHNACFTIVQQAFEAGRTLGKNQAAEELKKKMFGILEGTAETESAEEAEGKRAARGTVRPAVIKALQDSPVPLGVRDIAVVTGINENSVRGMLNKLAEENMTLKIGDRWMLRPPPPPPPPPPPK